ncbi:efflux RND transporter periplasmic adaptor subunit [Pseudomonas maumuensis]|uniref:HlyD family efflux transporter periplasmic adaptor subunit n=1 Tax=Pseudomonas maumuensis TaxID=2842354 RepID=A0ABX8NPX1_9PSED|nr:HlyD family efflux transporter periplasmic adaptor subunit [Pseudomonas maumuensis]QXH58077.1 HlyD family efflux transporter periplasmic adaptor subunit [Pseudomonas maumuensis]
MDISIPQSGTRRLLKKHSKVLAVGVCSLVLLLAIYNYRFSPYQVALGSVAVAEVKYGDFSVEVRGNGVLLPRDINWVAANVDARVEEIIYKAGMKVSKGQLLVVMSNPTLEQRLQENQLELNALRAETEAKNAELQNKILTQEAVILEAKTRLLGSSLRLAAQKQYSEAVPRLEYETTRILTEQYTQQVSFEERRLGSLKLSVEADKKANFMRLDKMESLVALGQQEVDSLKVKSPIDGVLQDVSVQVGQRVTVGSDIARLAKETELYAELKVPELQSRDLAVGQAVTINTGRSRFTGVLSRVDPAVSSGTVKVDVTFNQPLPQEARPDLSVDGLIAVTKINRSLYVERPPFAQNNVSSTLYRLDKKDRSASKIKVDFGQGSADYIQITSGLQAGDKIILSDSTAWQGADRIEIAN